MSRLGGAWTAFWYASRAPHLARMLAILGFGLFLFGGGVFLLFRPSLPDEPVRLDFDEVMALLQRASPRFVSFEAELDFSKKIYETGWVPYWGHCPANEIHPLPPADAPQEAFRRLLGCRVKIHGAIDPGSVMRIVGEIEGNGEIARTEQRVLARIGGARQGTWVQSEAFTAGDPREAQWLGREEFTGILSTLEQAMSAWPAGSAREGLSGALPASGMFVIHDDSDAFYDDKARGHLSAHYWVPVKDSANSIFVWVAAGSENEFADSITGVLEPRERADYRTRNKGYAHFSVVTGEPLPERYGLIRYRTGKEYNDAEVTIGWPFVLFGTIVAGTGLFGLLVYLFAPGMIARLRGNGGQ